ncbi:MAG: DUF839 domain-containing protein [Pyrinomonadaceae bacterium]|nr:DUF839 domain-containing protein [Pyrinomonadaceae bacterium]
MNRRSFIRNISLFSGSLALAGTALGRRTEALLSNSPLSDLKAFGYGELVPTAAKNTGETYLALPKGFEYNVIGKVKEKMSDGRETPPRHDGMWAFKVGSELRLVRNHEVTHLRVPRPDLAIGTANHYDPGAGGGTTTLVIDPKTRTVIRDFVSLSGTLVNCAGGPTPWGSWITCEETTVGPTVQTTSTGTKIGGFAKRHGYCFEVQASANNNVPPVALTAMGRFDHEAVAVDRKSGVVYLTEDRPTAGFYRFVPKRNGRLAEGGTLQMLAIKGWPDYDSRTKQNVGDVSRATWVTINDPDPEAADTDVLAVYKQGKAQGAATFARLEGCVADDDGRVYFTATSGGDAKAGQIWVYEPINKDEGNLKLLFEVKDRSLLFMPDNVCLMPKTQLLFVCEDGDYDGLESKNHLRIMTAGGKMADFAANINKDFPRSEFAGSTFSPDGKTLFVNLQLAGVTLAIWGDWAAFKE